MPQPQRNYCLTLADKTQGLSGSRENIANPPSPSYLLSRKLSSRRTRLNIPGEELLRRPTIMRLPCWSILYITAVTLILPPESGVASATRAKRQLAFPKGTSFFYRLNYKIASIPSSTIFAQATGFKVTWKLPSSGMEKRKRRNVDDIHESTELVYDSHGFDGKACLAKNICQALDYINGREGVIVKILKLLTKKTYDNGTVSALDKIACAEYSARCPLELLGIDGLIDTSNNEF